MSERVGEGCEKPPETSKGNRENIAAVIIQHCCRPNGLGLKPRRSRAMEVWAGGGAPGWRPDQMINPYIDLPFSICSSESHAECSLWKSAFISWMRLSGWFSATFLINDLSWTWVFLQWGAARWVLTHLSRLPPPPPKCEGPVSCGECVAAEIFGRDCGDPD